MKPPLQNHHAEIEEQHSQIKELQDIVKVHEHSSHPIICTSIIILLILLGTQRVKQTVESAAGAEDSCVGRREERATSKRRGKKER